MITRGFFGLALLSLAGCWSFSSTKTLYEIKLVNGDSLYSESQPDRRGDSYQFDDVNDQEYNIKAHSVLYIQKAEFKK